jgi:hypothetical protein
MALVASELATLIKHAQGGLLILTPVIEDGRQGLQIEAHWTMGLALRISMRRWPTALPLPAVSAMGWVRSTA